MKVRFEYIHIATVRPDGGAKKTVKIWLPLIRRRRRSRHMCDIWPRRYRNRWKNRPTIQRMGRMLGNKNATVFGISMTCPCPHFLKKRRTPSNKKEHKIATNHSGSQWPDL